MAANAPARRPGAISTGRSMLRCMRGRPLTRYRRVASVATPPRHNQRHCDTHHRTTGGLSTAIESSSRLTFFIRLDTLLAAYSPNHPEFTCLPRSRGVSKLHDFWSRVDFVLPRQYQLVRGPWIEDLRSRVTCSLPLQCTTRRVRTSDKDMLVLPSAIE